MNPDFHYLLIPLLTAHLLADFVLRTSEHLANNRKPLAFLSHLAAVTLVSWLFLLRPAEWMIPLALFVTHGLIDLARHTLFSRFTTEPNAFLIDQALHLIVIIAISACPVFSQTPHLLAGNPLFPVYTKALLLLSGFIASTSMSAIVIEKFLPRILGKEKLDTKPAQGLPGGGRYIGYLERILILAFILSGEAAAIGFLIAAKSIFRFGDIKEARRDHTEYILIGTLLSFTLGVLAAILVSTIWKQIP